MGTYNTAVGCFSLYGNTTGHFNTGVGAGALFLNIGNENTAVGVLALFGNTIGVDNTAIGPFALQSNTTGNFNVALGNNALTGLTTGSNNIALGTDAGVGVSTGNSNIDIGNFGGGESATIRIGDPTIHAATFIAGISGTAVTGAPVVINGNGQLGVAPSSKRFKTDIKPMDKASETIFALKPVTFCYKKEIDPQSLPQFGLVAEEVERVNPDLVARDSYGKPFSVRYEVVNAMLLNEFLKEHRKVEQLEQQVEKLTAGLQKVSAQLEASKPAPQVVNSNQ